LAKKANWNERREQYKVERANSIEGAALTKEQKFLRGVEMDMGRRLMGLAHQLLRKFEGAKEVKASLKDLLTVIEAGSKLERLGMGMPQEAVQIDVRQNISFDWQQALDRIYGPSEKAKPIDVEPAPLQIKPTGE
jgi:hypothetical protein